MARIQLGCPRGGVDDHWRFLGVESLKFPTPTPPISEEPVYRDAVWLVLVGALAQLIVWITAVA